MSEARDRILSAIREGLAKQSAAGGIRDPGSGSRVSTAQEPGLGQARGYPLTSFPRMRESRAGFRAPLCPSALLGAALSDVEGCGPGMTDTGGSQPDNNHSGSDRREALREAFVAAVTALGGHVHDAAGTDEAAATVASILERYAATDFISWDDAELPCPGLLDSLVARGVRRVTYDVPLDPEGRAAVLAGLDRVGVGLTGVLAGVAASGTLVLASGPGRGRLPSLLPPVHVAVLRSRDLQPDLAAVLAVHPALVKESSNVVLITGPSRTADIEMTLTHGVHGPKHLHVVLLTETLA